MTETLTKAVWDGTTNEWSVIPLTAEEIAQRELDTIAAEEQRATQEAEAAAKAEAKASAEAKLAELGLTVDEIAALGN